MTFVLSVEDLIAGDKSGLLAKHESWERVRLADVASILNGYPFESVRFSPEKGTPLLRIRDVLRGHTETFYEGEFPPEFLVNSGDTLIGMDGDFHCAVWRGEPALLNQRVCKVTACTWCFDDSFLLHLLPAYLRKINSATPSITVKHLSSRTVQDILLPLPPVSEQRRIAGKLDELFSDLDAGAALLQRARANLKRYRAAVLKSAVEGRLTADWRARHSPSETGNALLARLLRERRLRWEEAQLEKFKSSGKAPPEGWRSKYAEPSAPDASVLTPLPDGWCWASVDQLARSLRNGLSPKPSPTPPGLPILRISAVRPMQIDLTESRFLDAPLTEVQDYFLESGDILFTRYNGSIDFLGVAAVVPEHAQSMLYPDKLIRVRLLGKGSFPLFLSIAANVGVSRRHIEGRARTTAGQTGISGGDIKEMPIPLPPLAEQDEIVRLVDQLMVAVSRTEKEFDSALARGLSLRQSILKRAFSGRLVPQDPADEPASVLLERIRASRVATPDSRRRVAKAPSPPRSSAAKGKAVKARGRPRKVPA